MRAGRTTIIAVVAALGLVTAACGGSQQNAGSTTTTPATTGSQGNVDKNKVNFANDLCGALSKFIVSAASYKPDMSSPAAAVNSLKTQLGTMSAGLTEATKDLNDVSTAGVPDGQAAVTELQKTFGQLKDTIDRSKTKLDAVDPNNQQSVAAAVQDVGKELAGVGNMQNPLDQPALKGADMEAAAEQAPECQQIKKLISAKAGGGSMTPTS